VDLLAPQLWRVDAGLVRYAAAYEWQRDLHARRVINDIPDVLLLLEHHHVYTLGRRFSPRHLLLSDDELQGLGIDVFESDRGGSITYHGPGQLVAYPVVDLREPGRAHADVIRYLRKIEEAIIAAVTVLGVEATTREGLTGVWVGNEKLAAIGVNISRGVAKHGLALNVNTNLEYFRGMVPCGIEEGEVTSLEKLLGKPVSIEEVAGLVAESLAEVLERRLVPSNLSDLGLTADSGQPFTAASWPLELPQAAGQIAHA
jgi:lipoyl(octanoyl) transferase